MEAVGEIDNYMFVCTYVSYYNLDMGLLLLTCRLLATFRILIWLPFCK